MVVCESGRFPEVQLEWDLMQAQLSELMSRAAEREMSVEIQSIRGRPGKRAVIFGADGLLWTLSLQEREGVRSMALFRRYKLIFLGEYMSGGSSLPRALEREGHGPTRLG